MGWQNIKHSENGKHDEEEREKLSLVEYITKQAKFTLSTISLIDF